MDLFRGYPFYKFKISATATDDENKIYPISIMGICNVSEVSFHGTFGRSIMSMNGTIYDYFRSTSSSLELNERDLIVDHAIRQFEEKV
ncbi:MAG: hypothetical protein NWE90_03990 [Candidatus Bathyarchaeota archaeon]|nr:hypothetical protein [Candidatus Bathyarchaeota archaeon]